MMTKTSGKMKHLICACISIVMLISCASAAVTQYGELVSSMTDDELLTLKLYLDNELDARGLLETGGISAGAATQALKEEVLVWISEKGYKYHSHAGCSNMSNPWTITLETAKLAGRTACKKCNPPQ